MSELVSVIVPAVGDPATLLSRCLPSIEAQTYPNIETIVVVDGRGGIPEEHDGLKRRVVHLGRNWHSFTPQPSWGTMARLVASGLARGRYIAYCDQDDALRPLHVERLVRLLESKHCDWVYSQMAVYEWGEFDQVIGNGTPTFRTISTQMLLHRVEQFHKGNFDPYCKANTANLRPEDRHLATYASDWDLVQRWIKRGGRWAFLPEVTVNHFREDAFARKVTA